MAMVTIVRRGRTRKARSAGFTLVDVVISTLIVGILAAAAAPKFADALHRSRADAAAKRVRADLSYGRQVAISNSTPLTVNFFPVSNDYTFPTLADLNHPGQAYAVSLATAPYHAQIDSASLGGDGTLQFDRYGRPDSGGTITVSSGSHQETVTIDPDTGKVTIP